jgi:hypothetical protein
LSMLGKKLSKFLKEKLGHLVGRIREGARLAPALLKKPAVALHWLLSARMAQVTIIVLALTVPTVITGAVDILLEKIHPPRIHEELLGLMKKTYTNPRLEDSKELARNILWAGSGSLVFLLLVMHIPAAVKSADERARKRERQADTHLDAEPLRSLLLYRSALKLATDTGHIASLRNKIGSIDEKILGEAPGPPGVQDGSVKQSDRERTVVLSPPSSDSLHHIGAKDRYRITAMLGQGGMGITYRASDSVLERDVALKKLLPDMADEPEFASRFRQEAKVLARLTHPGIVQVYDFIEEGGQFWIVMELIRGGELADLLKERGYLTVPEAARLGVQMAEAMGYAHARGIVHRDFKPSNVMLTAGGSPKITDFGLATFARSSLKTGAGEVAGSPHYMSPEQTEGRTADSRSDVYSMGAVLYQMLTGKVPFDGNDVESVLDQHRLSDPLPPRRILTDIPDELNSLVLTMLAKNPEERMQDMTGIAKVLKKYVVVPVMPETSVRS